MSLSLAKEQTKVKLILTKNKIEDVKFNVELFIDVSGSMSGVFRNGVMESVLQRTLAMSSKCDPDGNVRFVAFSDDAADLGEFDIASFESPAQTFLNAAKDHNVLWGGTDYACAFETSQVIRNDLIKNVESRAAELLGKVAGKFKNMFSFGKKEVEVEVIPVDKVYPRLVVFQTDGENGGSHSKFLSALQECVSDDKTFVIMLGIGGRHSFSPLMDAANQVHNTEFVTGDFSTINDDKFYDMILTPKFSAFLSSFK